jgi:hypothetical protein
MTREDHSLMAKNLPAEKPDAVLVTMGGQAALFDDPLQVLGLNDQRFTELVAVVRSGGESLIAGVRRYVGLLAWAAWHRYDEKRYKEFVADFADRLGVEPRNVLDWRRAVTKSDNLPLPAVAAMRSEARKTAGRKPSDTRLASIPAASTEAPKLPERPAVPASRTPAPSGPTSAGGGPSSGAVSPPAGPNPTERPPTYRTQAARVLATMRDVEPADAGPALTEDDATFLRQWAQRTLAAWKDAQAAAPAPAGCPHPKARRRNAGYAILCDDCGTVVR